LKCRHCNSNNCQKFLDLGYSPLANSFLTTSDLNLPETYYPLRVWICRSCWLAQTEDFASPTQLFTNDYVYHSSTSISWLSHAKDFATEAIKKFALSGNSKVVEIASNDGYLLTNFVDLKIPSLGIEPASVVAELARAKGVEVINQFFNKSLATDLAFNGHKADLLIGNNVYAHVPDINDFTDGLATLLKPEGVVSLEFPHLLNLIEGLQFDTVYHEHFSYLSLTSVEAVFDRSGLRVWDVEELATHGGSLRVFGCLKDASWKVTENVVRLRNTEFTRGISSLSTYESFQHKVEKVKLDLLEFLVGRKQASKSVASYGAAAKGVTLLNFCGVSKDILPFVADASPAKQGRFLPGSHLPVVCPQVIVDAKPDFILILPWNLANEIKMELKSLEVSGTRFLTAIPHLRYL
jgi:hypothetical protein